MNSVQTRLRWEIELAQVERDCEARNDRCSGHYDVLVELTCGEDSRWPGGRRDAIEAFLQPAA
jgi:hypothetical protein